MRLLELFLAAIVKDFDHVGLKLSIISPLPSN